MYRGILLVSLAKALLALILESTGKVTLVMRSKFQFPGKDRGSELSALFSSLNHSQYYALLYTINC